MSSCSTKRRASLAIFFNKETQAEKEAAEEDVAGVEVASSFHSVISLRNKLPERTISCQSSKEVSFH